MWGKRKIHSFYIIVDILGIIAIFSFLFILFKKNYININLYSFNLWHYVLVAILWSLLIFIFFQKNNLYSTDRFLNIIQEVNKILVSFILVSLIVAAVIFILNFNCPRYLYFVNFLGIGAYVIFWRVLKRIMVRKFISYGFHRINVLIIGEGAIINKFIKEINKYPYLGFNVVGILTNTAVNNYKHVDDSVSVLGRMEDLELIVRKYFVEEVIVLSKVEHALRIELVKKAKNLKVGIRFLPVELEEIFTDFKITYLGFLPFLTYSERVIHPAESISKRCFDIIFSILALIILSPFLILIMLVIRLDSSGPVFYRQLRVGRKGNKFTLYKFRSMFVDAERKRKEIEKFNEIQDGVIFKIRNDPRVTSVGRILRKYSIDEIPQLFNILLGDMSLVGPRPPLPEEVEKYKNDQLLRLTIKPGMTGLSQIKGRSDLTFKKWVRLDLWYINNWSFTLDLWILWKTIPAVLKGKGAY